MKKTLLFLSVVLTVLTSCDKSSFDTPDVQTLWVTNNAAFSISTLLSEAESSDAIPDKKGDLVQINAGNNLPYTFLEKTWEDVYKKFPNDTITVFIFKTSDLDNGDWQKIRENKSYIKKFSYTISQLKTAAYKMAYP